MRRQSKIRQEFSGNPKPAISAPSSNAGDAGGLAAATEITPALGTEQLPGGTDTVKQVTLMLLDPIDELNGQLYYLKQRLFGKKNARGVIA